MGEELKCPHCGGTNIEEDDCIDTEYVSSGFMIANLHLLNSLLNPRFILSSILVMTADELISLPAAAIVAFPDNIIVVFDLHDLIAFSEGNLAEIHFPLIKSRRVQSLL